MSPAKPQLYVLYAVAAVSVVLLAPYAGCHLLTTAPVRTLPVQSEPSEPDSELDQGGAFNEQGQPTSPPVTKDLSDIERMLAE